ncbi:MAG: glycosyltransferase [Candidatus Aenigmatarchaeota archaeon]
MIYVTVGGHPGDFTRLIKTIDDVSVFFNEEFIIQKGYTKYKPKNCKYFDFVVYSDGENFIKNAKLVISHAGAGTIILSRKYNKPIIIFPRLRKYKEHVNDHQLEICKELEKTKKNIFIVYEENKLKETIEYILDNLETLKSYSLYENDGKEKIIKEIRNFINENTKYKILAINSLDTTYGSTHRFRKLLEGLSDLKDFKIIYIESNTDLSCAVNIKQKNNFFGFLYGTLLRTFYTLIIDFDILFTQTFTPLTVFSILFAKLKGKKVIVDWDDLSWVLQKNWFRSMLVRFCEHKFIKFADMVLVPNKYLMEYAKKAGAKEVYFIPHGVDFDLFNPDKYNGNEIRKELGIEKNKIVLGFLASFTTGGVSDLDFIFDVVKEVMKIKENIYFLVIGGGPLFKQYKNLAEKMGLKNTIFTGLIRQKDVPKYLSCVDIALVYMRDNIKNKMKTSLKVGEYLAMNKIVVGHLVGQTKDDFEKYCITCEPTKESFMNKIITTIDNIEIYRNLNYRNEIIKYYTWEKGKTILRNLIDNIEKNFVSLKRRSLYL